MITPKTYDENIFARWQPEIISFRNISYTFQIAFSFPVACLAWRYIHFTKAYIHTNTNTHTYTQSHEYNFERKMR